MPTQKRWCDGTKENKHSNKAMLNIYIHLSLKEKDKTTYKPKRKFSQVGYICPTCKKMEYHPEKKIETKNYGDFY